MPEKYLTSGDVAAMLSMPYSPGGHGGNNRRVWRLMAEMGGFKLGKQWRIKESMVHDYMAKLANKNGGG